MKAGNTENIPVGKWRLKDKMNSIQNPILQDLSKSVVALDLEAVKDSTKKALDAQIAPQLIIKDGLNPGLVEVGTKFANGEYFLSQLIWAGQIMTEAMIILEPHLATREAGSSGKIVIATVEGDLHDIGKNIAITMLKSAGFEIIDLGVDVPAAKIVETVEETDADIVALSALLSVVEPFLKETVKALRESRIGNKVKILLGGRIVDDEKAKQMGADAWAKDAWDGIAKAKGLV